MSKKRIMSKKGICQKGIVSYTSCFQQVPLCNKIILPLPQKNECYVKTKTVGSV
jgi:hypothetical protein